MKPLTIKLSLQFLTLVAISVEEEVVLDLRLSA